MGDRRDRQGARDQQLTVQGILLVHASPCHLRLPALLPLLLASLSLFLPRRAMKSTVGLAAGGRHGMGAAKQPSAEGGAKRQSAHKRRL